MANNNTPETALELIINAYIAILKTDGLWRIQNQMLFCELRNYIAAAQNRTSEEVQNEYEEIALKEKYNLA